MKVNPWVAVLVILLCFVGVGTYAYQKHGLPLMCYKDSQHATISPGGNNKLVDYHWNCRRELFGIDFGPAGWAATGFEIVPKDEVIPRHGFPAIVHLRYTKESRTKENKEIPPPVRIVWQEGSTIKVYHSPGLQHAYSGVRGYYLDFREEGK